jgi:branched-chain amino acid transport system permease protein
MSAAKWRRAMSAPVAVGGSVSALPAAAARPLLRPTSTAWLGNLLRNNIRPRHLVVFAIVLVYPWIATPFFTFQIGGQTLALGLVALSLTLLGGYGGMISLAQMTIAGIAGYMVAIFGISGTAEISLNWPWWIVLPLALGVATLCATFIGWLSVRTEGIYTIMITLAIGVGFYYLCLQNYSIFNGFQGLQKVYPPALFGVDWRSPIPYYYLALFWALAGYFFVKHLVRSPFGVALQGVRDNPRRMNSLGFNVTAHRVAAYAVAGFIAAVGGVLLVWYNSLITPGSIGTTWLINILIIAVLGGLRHPIGPFLGALIFVVLQNFAIDVFDRERFNLVIGIVFLAIVLFSPDGLLGLWAKLRARFARRETAGSNSFSTPRRDSRL